MAELLVRVGGQDGRLIDRVLKGPAERRPSRVVMDAHLAGSASPVAAAARTAGVPFLIDPQTHYLQDYQHAGDAWAQLPYARAAVITPADLLQRPAAYRLATGVVDYQLEHGATAIIAPYLHVDRAGDGWAGVQSTLWQATARHLDHLGIHLPVIAVMALGWRLLDRTSWPEAVRPLSRALDELEPTEVALAASRVDGGAVPADRLSSMIAVIRQLSRSHPVLAWQQGTLGEAAVAGGAIGYECGIGWRERCDLPTAMRAHRKPAREDDHPGPRPVYVERVRRSIPKRSIEALAARSASMTADLTCLDPTCCPNGRRALLEDARAHAITSRIRTLQQIAEPAQPAWRWQRLAHDARTGLRTAQRINNIAQQVASVTRIDTSALKAIATVAENRRQTLRRRHVA